MLSVGYRIPEKNILLSTGTPKQKVEMLKAAQELKAKGYNLFNRAYAESAGVSSATYKYPAQGRRFIIGAEYTF